MLKYPWKPYEHTYTDARNIERIQAGTDTVEDFKKLTRVYCINQIEIRLRQIVPDLIHISIQLASKHDLNIETVALFEPRIPDSVDNNQTTQFLIAFLYEKELGFPEFLEKTNSTIYFDRQSQKYKIPSRSQAIEYMILWSNRAEKIVEILTTARSKIAIFAQDADFIRDWALIDLGEKTGLEVTANNNNFMVGLIQNGWRHYSQLVADQSIKLEKLSGLQVPLDDDRRAGRDDITITAKNGPSEVRFKTSMTTWGDPFVLIKDASRVVTKAEMQFDIESSPINIPIILRQLADVSLNVGVVESVSLTDLFDGIRFNITAVSADTSKVTVAVNQRQSSMGITGKAVGTSKVTVTATNEAGSISVDLNVTVS